MQLDDLKIFLSVIRAGSFTDAAEQLMLSKQYVSRRMAALEETLGAQLLLRNTRKLSVTEAGHRFSQHAQRILDDVIEAQQDMSSDQQALQGIFKISLPMSFGMSHLSPLLAEFLAMHPALQFQVELADRYVDMVGEGFDIAIRIGTLPDSSLMARRFGELKRLICASPDYLLRTGTPQMPEELRQHACLRFGREGINGWELRHNGSTKLFDVSGPMVSNNGEVLRDAAVAGLGLVLLPDFIVAEALQERKLVQVLSGFEPAPLNLTAVFPQHRQRSKFTRLFLDFLQQKLSQRFNGGGPRL
ncbi:LysR family transcriptional regulator [Pantoea sp. A4]|uniref:LysR family transcriptional regulator n=1 Tax=Pantoea sp. A4 TaxID=1225184 RepID=UPI0003657761|nr:LysR family transcriptional regulator [Pantoea sp. A4]